MKFFWWWAATYLALLLLSDELWHVVSNNSGPWAMPWFLPALFVLILIGTRRLLSITSRYAILASRVLLILALPYHHTLILNIAASALVIGIMKWWPRRSHTIVLGHRLRWLPEGLPLTDRFLHLHVVGPTGSGKSSSILMPLIEQDLKAKHAITLIEPKGDLAYTAYQKALTYGQNVIYFNPHLDECPHYNPLNGPADVAAEGIAWALNQISEAGHPFYAVTARIQLMYSVLAVKEALHDDADLTHILEFLRLDKTRKEYLAEVQDPRVLGYFRDQIGQIGAKTAQEQRQGLYNRLELLLVNPDVRRVLSGPGDFTWDNVLQDNWNVICPISPARLGESARVLGTLLWHGLAMATYRRQASAAVNPYFLYLDEFHQYVTPDLGDFLALARGYSVGIVLAHQDLGQLTPALKEALMANARHRIMFGGIAADDLRLFNQMANPHPLPEDLRYLARGHAYVQLTKKGQLQKPRAIALTHIPLNGSNP